MVSSDSVRGRRSTEEIRALLLASATQLFGAQGYHGVSTREIAAHASVAERLIFRHFGSKAGLLRHVLTEPFTDFLTDFLRHWEEQDGSDVRTRTLEYIDRLLGLFEQHRDGILVLLAESAGERAEGSAGAANPLGTLFDALASVASDDLGAPSGGISADLTVRFTFGLVASQVLLDDWIYDPAHRPDRSELVSALASWVMQNRGSSLPTPA